VAAYVAFGLPAFCLMLALTIIYSRSHELPAVISLFAGLQVIVVALIGNATINFGRKYLKNIRDIGLAILIALFLGLGGSPVLAILSAAFLALFLYRTDEHGRQHDGQTPVTDLSWSRMRPALNLAGACLGALLLLFVLDRTLFVLAVLMMKIDFFAFGGGFASVPLLFHEIVNVHHWMDNQTLMDGIALGQVTPGPIVITATFAGYLLSGFAGAVVGTVFIFTPSLFLLFLVTPIFDRLQHAVLFQRGIRGILVSFVGLLLSVTIHFALTVHWQPVSVLIATAAFAALYRKVNILYVVLAGAAVSIFLL
jgi:chromate transporter